MHAFTSADNISFASIAVIKVLANWGLQARNSRMRLNVYGFVCVLLLVSGSLFAQSDAYTLQRLLMKYTETYGGGRDADKLSSISIEGSIEQNGQNFDFLMRKKRPYSMRYRLSLNNHSIETGYNGRSGWLRVEEADGVKIDDVKSDALRSLRREACFENPLFRHMEKRENEVELIGREQVEGSNTFVVKVTQRGAEETLYYLESQTACILRRDQLNASGEVIYQTFYRDFKEIEGHPFAHEIENVVAGERVSLAKVKRLDVNPGLLNFYFEKPKH